MATLENNMWFVGRVTLDFDHSDLLTLNFDQVEHNTSELKHRAAVYLGPMLDWIQPILSGLDDSDHWSWALKCLYPNTILRTDNQHRSRKIYTVIFLDNRTQCNYFELNGQLISNWCPGTYVAWQDPVETCQVNLSDHNRYYLELTARP